MITSISPIDGRYEKDVKELSAYFSEYALFQYRLRVEIEYLIALGNEKGVRELKPFTRAEQARLHAMVKKFSVQDAKRVSAIEKTTNHDVKALEYFVKEKLAKTSFRNRLEWFHFALTSEDVNNLAYALMWKDALALVVLPSLQKILKQLNTFASRTKNDAMLSFTHGQPATPTTVGKELAVFAARLLRQYMQLTQHNLCGKLGGAVGTWSAHVLAYPNVNWLRFSEQFIRRLGLEPNLVTTQIENHDSLAESAHILMRANAILLDLTRDMWLYISRGIFTQKKREGEIGSSTMPHKINPIMFENAEGNLGLANALLTHLAEKLPISRMQRDLSDSTVLRNQGVALAHSLLAIKNLLKGLARVAVNKTQLAKELTDHPEVLAEAVQTILRKVSYEKPYEALKELTRGERVTLTSLSAFVKSLDIPRAEKKKLLRLTPQEYTGLAAKIVSLQGPTLK